MTFPYGLLLLPTAPEPPDQNTLSVCLRPTLEHGLRTLSTASKAITDSPSSSPILDVALQCPGFDSIVDTGFLPTALFHRVEKLLFGVYTLVSSIQRELSTRSSLADSIKVRIALFVNDNQFGGTQNRAFLPTPVIPLPMIARARRPWSHVFSIHSEQGEKLYQEFLWHAFGEGRVGPRWDFVRIGGGLYMRVPPQVKDYIADLEFSNSHEHSGHHLVVSGLSGPDSDILFKVCLTMMAFLLDVNPPDGESMKLLIALYGSDYRQKDTTRCREKAVEFLSAIADFTPAAKQTISDRASGEANKSILFNGQHRCEVWCVSVPILEHVEETISDSTALVIPSKLRQVSTIGSEVDIFEIEPYNEGSQ
ncbi:hypothetical protein M501DRAFT_1001097 [Patellaria atrata CBS 101060]|uniref:Uncharacterized protein n=1 Tax=Patellaria atrata CBS 101060 TaxID=1346257 RepID=A0A9P4S1L1_9PEZI|nr:hypothetical protein M501DRAFT_1001097 [Patellaria atrata CBS 101060]